MGLLRFGYKYLEARIADPTEPILPSLIDEMTAAWGGGLLFALAVPAMVRFPITRESWRRRLPAYLAMTVAFSVAHTWLNAATRSGLYPLFGIGAYDYGAMALRIPMELGNDIIFFWLFVGLVHGFLWYRDLRDREIRAARLETALTRAHVANLRERLHPHFLFNTLNAISSEMYRDVETADRMISRLSDLLRAALDSDREQETPLERELALLETYLGVMRMRFGERLVVRVDVAAAARDALVPALLLQPLVENAIRHGVAERAGRGEVRVRAGVVRRAREAGNGAASDERDAGETADIVRIEVLDDGTGLACDPADALRGGTGLSTTAARLHHLYGDAASLTIENRRPRGVRVAVILPYRPTADADSHA